MSHFVIQQARAISEQRTRLFWMERFPREMKVFPYGRSITGAYFQLQHVHDLIGRGDAVMVTRINGALLALEDASESLKQVRETERARQFGSMYKPLVRYDLVHGRNGRDAGVGRVANRWIECALDACRVTLPNQDGVVQHDFLGPVLNSSTGVETYRTMYGATRSPRDDVELEFEMVKELLDEVHPSIIQAAAVEFVTCFEEGDVDTLANWLRADVQEFSCDPELREQLRDLTLPNAPLLSIEGVGGALRDKLRALRGRCGAT